MVSSPLSAIPEALAFAFEKLLVYQKAVVFVFQGLSRRHP